MKLRLYNHMGVDLSRVRAQVLAILSKNQGPDFHRNRHPRDQEDRPTTNLNVAPVDPRDIEWENTHPIYRVYFWDSKRVSDEYEITGTTITDVLAWTTENAADRGWEIWLCLTQNGRKGAIKLQEFDMPPDPGEAIEP